MLSTEEPIQWEYRSNIQWKQRMRPIGQKKGKKLLVTYVNAKNDWKFWNVFVNTLLLVYTFLWRYYTTTFWKKYLLSNYGLTKIGPLNLDFQIFVFYAYVAQDNKISTNTNTTYVYPTLSLVSEIFQVSTLSCLLFNWLSSVLNMKIISPKYKLSANWGRRCPGKI